MSMQDVEQQVAENGLGHEEILAFFQHQPTSDVLALRVVFKAWVEQMTAAGADVDSEWVDRALHDLNRHGRLSHEFIIGAPHAEYVSLDHSKDYHFA